MAVPDFEQVLTKIRWAHHQMALLQKAVASYTDSEPYVAVVEDQPEAKTYRVTAKLERVPPPEVALIFGDFLNTLHGVMDYIAWQLLLLIGKQPGQPTAYPIQRLNEDGSEPVVNIRDKRKKHVVEHALILQALDSTQPYRDGKMQDFNPFEIVRRLNRVSQASTPRRSRRCRHTRPVRLRE